MRRLVVAIVALALVSVACSSDDNEGFAGGDTRGASAEVHVSGSMGAKPEISIPDGAPPSSLKIEDLVTGDGAEAKLTSTVTVQYVGVSWSTKEQFDASWDGGQPATFPVQGVIAGWQQGIPGMKVGGRRLLVIPPELGYPQGTPDGAIKAGETLVFVVDLVAVQ